ncbi:MAG TPA: hypothetical protein VJ851_00760 [Jatrophihabitans sp.]|nr:hypothetical protein [Jatrophihabitans sp.]
MIPHRRREKLECAIARGETRQQLYANYAATDAEIQDVLRRMEG